MGDIPTVTLTVLFTDAVRSTDLSSRLAPDDADAARRGHFAALRAALEAAGGEEVKSTGDGLMVVFASARAALDAAVTMQQSVQRDRFGVLAMRIGISTGDATEDEGDYYGPPVVEAARLCAEAEGGQIIVSDVVQRIARRGEHRFRFLGDRPLKGLPDPVPAYEVAWEPAHAPAVALPAALAVRPRYGLFGREGELVRMLAAWAAVQKGEPRVVLVSGEAGIGKTSLAAELARRAADDGALVLYGRCDEEDTVPFRPFADVLRRLTQLIPADIVERHVAEHGGGLLRLVPEVAARIPGLEAPPPVDPETDRHLLFAGVASLLAETAAIAPVVLVLDDLHWADASTVGLLRHLARAEEPRPVLLVGLYRGTDMGPGHPLATSLAVLHRECDVEILGLSGLGDTDAVALLRTAAGHDLDQAGIAFARMVCHKTNGNPFYLIEVLSNLAESGRFVRGSDGRWVDTQAESEIPIPHSVRDVVSERVVRLGEPAARVLSRASVLGAEFDLPVLAGVLGSDEDEVLDSLDLAVGSGLLVEITPTGARYGFAHALVQQSLYRGLSATRRRRTHLKAARQLEPAVAAGRQDLVIQLAFHAAEGAEDGDPAALARARDHARAAADWSLEQLAPQQAIDWYRRALAFTDRLGEEGGTARGELLVRLGLAQLHAGEAGFRETLLAACRLARDLGDRDLLVRAALANNRGIQSATGQVDAERLEMLDAALAAVGEDQPAVRARLLALAAVERLYAGGYERRRALADEALALARRSGDPAALVAVLNLRHNAIKVPETVAERMAETAESVALSRALTDPLARYWASEYRVRAAAEAGDLAEVDHHLSEIEDRARRLGQPALRWYVAMHRSWRMLVAGDIAGAEAAAEEARRLGEESNQPEAGSVYGVQLLSVRREQGREAELEPVIAAAVDANPGIPALAAVLNGMRCRQGRVGEARRALRREVADGFAGLPYDSLWSSGLASWAEVCGTVRDRRAAAALRERLAPFAGILVHNSATCHGPVDRLLGLLAGVLGRYDEAEASFEAAIAWCNGAGAPLWLARTQLDWAAALLERDGTGDRTRAGRLVEAARQATRGRAAVGLERTASELASRAAVTPA